MNYDDRIAALQKEHNDLYTQLGQPLSRLSFLQGQIAILLEIKQQEEQAKKPDEAPQTA